MWRTDLRVSYCIKQSVGEHGTITKHLYRKKIQVSSVTNIPDHF